MRTIEKCIFLTNCNCIEKYFCITFYHVAPPTVQWTMPPLELTDRIVSEQGELRAGARASSELVQERSFLRTVLLFRGLESHHRATSLRYCIRLICPSNASAAAPNTKQSPSKGCLSIRRTCFLGYCVILWTRSSMTTLALSAQHFINFCCIVLVYYICIKYRLNSS